MLHLGKIQGAFPIIYFRAPSCPYVLNFSLLSVFPFAFPLCTSSVNPTRSASQLYLLFSHKVIKTSVGTLSLTQFRGGEGSPLHIYC
jgi:hypothetical protein